MEYTKGEWKLTDQETEEVTMRGGNIAEAQRAKKQAYLKAGGIILNPDALPELYEACKGLLENYSTNPIDDDFYMACVRARQALAKAKSK